MMLVTVPAADIPPVPVNEYVPDISRVAPLFTALATDVELTEPVDPTTSLPALTVVAPV